MVFQNQETGNPGTVATRDPVPLSDPVSNVLPSRAFYACSSRRMSILSISSIAFMTRRDFSGSGSLINLGKAVGTICQDTPNLSFSQPQRDFWPPAESFSHSSSTSSCVSQFITSEIASFELKLRPAVQPEEFLAVYRKFHDHDHSFWAGPCVSVTAHGCNACILKRGSVKVCRFFGVAIEP
jgi:hypothetical protein